MKKGIPKQYIRHSLWARYSESFAAKLFYVPLLAMMFAHYLYIVLRFRPDVISPQSREDQLTLTLIGRLLRIPVVWRDPGDLVPQISHQSRSLLQRCNKALLLRSISKANAIFTLNADDRQQLLKRVPALKPEHITVIGSNILFEDYQVKAEQSGSVVIGAMSQLHPHKGVDVLIKAFLQLQKHKPHARLALYIVGDGPERTRLEKLAGSNEAIRFFGYQKDISRYMNQFTIFVQPSLYEGWGRSVKEAKLFGLAVVGSNVGGIVRQITHEKTGLLFQPGSVTELAVCLDRLVDDPKLRTDIQKASLASAQKEGDWHRTVAEQIIPLFESVLQQK